MKRMLLTISYDGSAYHGWQVQPNGITVQSVLQDSLEKLIGTRPGVTGCSRTDAGVHALEFCCHFDCDDSFPEITFVKGLNSVLPKDIAVKDCRRVADDFHARYSSKGKQYVYRIYNSAVRDPFKSRYAWQIERELDIDRMNEFCEKICGTHDFAAFSASGRTVSDTVRTVSECFVKKEEDFILLKITADGVLYNMVRIITGTAVGISDGKIAISDTDYMFASGDRSAAGITAPPNGLFLNKVLY